MNRLHLRWWARFALTAALLAARPALASEPPPASVADQLAILTLFVNHVNKGEVTVVLRGADVLVAAEDLARSGIRNAPAPAIGPRRLVSLTAAAPLSFKVEEAALALRIETPARMLETTIVRLTPDTPPGMVLARDTSAYLNYGVRASYPLSVDGFLDAGLSIDGNLLATTMTISSGGGAVRGQTSFTVDDRANLRRWVVGDQFVSGGALGGGAFLGGFGVSRVFGLDPYFVHTPSLGYSGATTAPATLDIYVNGVLVKSQALPPGPFQVQNVQVPSGAGVVRYVVRDIFGQQQAVSSAYYAGATALAAGLSEFSYVVGATRANVGSESFGYGAAGLLLRHRYGLTDRVTLGGRLEAAPDLVSGGPSLTLMLPAGQIDLEAGASAAVGGNGVAGQLGYSYTSRQFGGGVVLRAVSDHYATLGLLPSDNRERMRVNAFTSVGLGPRVSLGAQYAFALDRDQGGSFHVGVTATIQIVRRLSLALGLGRSQLPASAPSFDASAGLTLALENGVSAALNGRYGAGTREVYADVNKSLPAGDGFGFRAHGVASETPAGLANVQYQGPYGRYQATAQIGPGGPGGSLEAAGSLLWVRGAGVLPARPVLDGFAIIRVPDAPRVRGYLNNQDIGRTNGRGELAVPNLLAYYGNRLAVADGDLALDRGIDVTEKIIATPFRGGALVLFDAKRSRFVRGRVRVAAAAGDQVPTGGELILRGPEGEATSPLGNDGEFELPDVAAGEHEVRVVHAKGACSFRLKVSAANRFITEVGVQRCTPEKSR